MTKNNADIKAVYDNKTLPLWLPPPDLRMSQWADEKFYLSPESAAEPGKWKTYPQQVGPLDAIGDIKNHTVTIKKSARVGYTKMIDIAIGYHIEQDPCSQLVVQPTIEDGAGFSRDEIETMIRDTPCLTNLVADAKSRDAKNTVMKKYYPGGILHIIGANSARGFRRLTVRIVYFDEVDGYPATAGQEGDQIKLGMKRTETFWNRLHVIGSTPTVKGFSRVSDSFGQSDMRFFHVPCPRCKHMQVLKWSNIKFPDRNNLSRIYYECESCGHKIPHKQKRWMLEHGDWIASRPFNGHAGFHLWAAYSLSPGASWSKIAERFLEANQYYKDTGDPKKLQTWTNVDLGEDWEEKGKGIDSIEIFDSRKMDIRDGTAPDGVIVITAGVDVQDDRIEIEFVGWGIGYESWSLNYVVVYGDPEQPEIWEEVDASLSFKFKRGASYLHVACVAIDHGAHSAAVEDFVKPRQGRRIFAVKGRSTPGGSLVGKPSKKSLEKGFLLYPIGTETGKDRILSWLGIEKPGPGYCHFPDWYEDDYFKQLTAEEKFTKYIGGRPVQAWRLKPGRLRNEALDVRNYAYCARMILNPRLDKILAKLEARDKAANEADTSAEGVEKPPNPVKKEKKKKRKSRRGHGFVKGYMR
jgi:phage terminase large subunit GpA-like protein